MLRGLVSEEASGRSNGGGRITREKTDGFDEIYSTLLYIYFKAIGGFCRDGSFSDMETIIT